MIQVPVQGLKRYQHYHVDVTHLWWLPSVKLAAPKLERGSAIVSARM